MSIADAIKRRESNKKSNNTSFDARLYVKEKYRKKKADEFGYDTLETDLNSLGTTIKGIYDGWQTEETMRNTRSSIESMYNRLTSYQDYRKTYGITDGEKDIADLVNNYKTTLDNWDSLTSHYGEYKDADAYKKAEKAQADAKKRKNDMANADLDVVKKEITDLEGMLKKANDYNSKVSGYQTSESAAQRYSGRNGFVYNPDNENSKKLNSAQKELNEYLKSVGYSSVDDIKKALKDKQSFLEEAKVIQENNYFTKQAQEGYGIQGYEKHVLDEQKRKEYAQANQPSAFEEGVIRGFTTSSDNPFSTIINNIIYDKRKDDSYQKPNEEWTQEAKYEFGARYLESPLKAYEYAAEYNNALANKKKDETKEKVGKSSTESGWGAIGNWMGARLTAPLGLVDYLDDLTDIAAGRDTIVQEGVLTPFEYSQTVGESQASALNEWSGTLNENIPVLGGKGIGDVYSLGNSIVDSKVSATTMGAYGTLINYFGQAAASGVDDAMSRGADSKQALLYGTAQGLAEGIPEMISADKFLKLGKKADIGFLGKVRKQAREEGTEELVTALLSNATDNAIMQDKSQFNVDVKNLMLKGLTEEEAKEKVWLDKAEGIAFDALGGYLSGGLSAAPIAAISNKYVKRTYGDSANDLIAQGLESSKDTDSYKLAEKLKQKVDSGKELSAKEIEKLVLANDDAYKTELKANAESRLAKLGGEIDNSDLAEIIAKKSVGEELTKSELKTLQNSKYGNRVYKEINNEDLMSFTENMSEDDADLFVSQYDGETDIDAYAKSFNLVSKLSHNDFSQDYILEHRGVLSGSQVNAIYKANVLDSDKKLQKTLDALKNKHKGAKFIAGTFDDSVIDYTNSVDDNVLTPNGNKVRWNKLNENQKKSIATLGEFFSGLGLDVTLISNGLERGINGAFEVDGNRVLLDVYAGIDKINASKLQDTIVPTASHEVVHWAKNLSPEIYRKLDNFVFKSLMSGTSQNEMDILSDRRRLMEEAHPDVKYTDAEVREEVIARACEDMLVNTEMFRKCCESMTESERKTFIDKVKEIIQNIKDWINDFISKQKSKSPEAEKIREDMARFQEQVKLFEEMIEDAALTNQALKHEGVTGEKLANKTSKNIQEMARTKKTNIDKYGYNADNVSRANKKGELVNDYYYALNKSEWTRFYAEIADSGYLATANVGVVAPIVVNNKLIIAERLYTGRDAHDYVVTDVYELFTEDGDNFTLSLLQDALDKGDISYDTQRIFSFVNKINRTYGRDELLARYNRDNSRFDITLADIEQSQGSSAIYRNSQEKIAGERLSLRDKPNIQGNDKKIKNSNRDVLEQRHKKLQDEYNSLNKEVEEIKNSEKYKYFVDALSTTSGEELDNLVKEYGEWTHESGLYDKSKRMSEITGEQKDIRAAIEDDRKLSRDAYMKSIENLTEKEKMDFVKKAVERYGTTNKVNLASYLMLNGKMLDFSEGQGYRVQDHREISEILDMPDSTEYSDGLIAFMNMGNIRLQTYGIDISQTPNQSQRDALRDVISQVMRENDEFSVDFSKTNGYTDGSVTYPKGTSTSKILADIDNYFNTGVVPEYESSVAKFRYSDRDSLGNALSKGQKSYFADSKMRDDNGNLMVMYQGSQEEFFEFDRKKSSYYNLYGRGFYFTNSKSHADQYGNVTRAYYLNIKNPIATYEGDSTITKAQLKKFLKVVAENEDYSIENYGTYDVDEIVNSVYGKSDYAMIQDISATAIGDLVEAIELFNKVNGTTFDGLILATETIIFNSEQAKLITNKNPTDNKDMRYSDRDKAYMDAVNKGDMGTAQRLVDEAAREAGYTVKAYHGTNQFGFTKFDPAMSDDKTTLFFTDDIGVAKTYAGRDIHGVKNISDAKSFKYEKGKVYTEEELKAAHDFIQSKWHVYGTTKINVEKQTVTHAGTRYSAKQIMEMADSISKQGIYGVYLNTNNFLEVDVGYKGWRDIKNPEVDEWKWEINYQGEGEFNYFKAKADDVFHLELLKNGESVHSGTIEFDKMSTLLRNAIGSNRAEMAIRNSTNGSGMNFNTAYSDKNGNYVKGTMTTREFAQYVKKQGYSGVAIKNMYDWGNRNSPVMARFVIDKKGASTIYILFDPNQVKSADPVTYDDKGNVIPLSQRFNKKNDDIRYSDRDYVITENRAAFTEKHIKELYEDYSVSSTSDMMKDYAQEYVAYINPSDFLSLTSLNGERIRNETVELDLEKLQAKDNRGLPYLEVDEETGEVYEHDGRHRLIAFENVGIEQVAIRIVPISQENKYHRKTIDINLKGQEFHWRNEKGKTVSEKAKGNVTITAYPLSPSNRPVIEQLFGTGKILYSDRDNVSVYDKLGETDRLIKDNEKLKADVERLKERLKIERQITNGNFFNQNQLDAVAGHIRNIANSNYDKKELVHFLNSIYQYIAHSPDLNWQDLYSQCYELADLVLDKSRVETVTNPYYKDILDDIRKTKISVNEQQIQNAKYRLGNKWRNSFFNKISISENGISLDSQWQEWASMYPNIFDADLSDADQLVELLDIYDSVRQASETVVEYDKEERTRWLAREIYNQYWNVSPIRTTADRYDKQIKKLNFEHRKAMQELRDGYDEKLKNQHKVDREKAQNLVKKIRDRKDKEIAEVKQKSKEMMDAYKENAERKTRIQSITSNALTLNKWLVKNSKDEHIHESLKAPVVNLLNAINFSSKRLLDKNIPTQKDISLSKALSQVKDMMVDASNGKEELVELYGHDMDEDIAKMVDSVYDIMRTVGDNEFVLNKMSLQSLQTLDKMVKTIKQSVSKMNKFHMVNHAKGIANLSQESMEYLDELGKAKVFDGLRGKAKKLLNWDNSLPCHAFKRFGEGGIKVFEAFQDGWDKFAFHIKKIIDYANDTYTSKEVKEWGETIKTFKILIPATEMEQADPNYKPKYQTVQMTIPQIMSLYCTQKREQGKNHILEGGIRVADFKTKKGEVVSQSDGAILTDSDVATIVSTLDARQKLVADKLQRFMNTTCTEWGNEVSMLRFGYMAFGEDNYFPIQSDQNNLAVNDETEKNNSLFRLLNMSFTKGLVKGANNRIVISDIFDVFAQHTSDMAKYNALALPVLDAFKWYNYKEKITKGNNTFITKGVKQSIESAFGKDGQDYFTTFLKDLNGEKEVTRDTLGGFFFKNTKIAAVGMNLRVMALQPTSYLRASAVIDHKYLTKALIHKPKISKAEQHCGIALWKSMGYYDTNIQKGVEEQIKHNDKPYNKLIERSMKGAEIADKITWGYLWNACELEIREKRKDLKVGSKEFYTEIGKRLREVIYSTQVVDSTMTRSQMMRSNNTWDKMITAFASEPTLAYSMLQDAYMGLQLDARRLGKKEAFKKNGKKIARVLVAYTLTNAMAALVESGFDAFRDDDEEEMDIEEFMKMYMTNFATDMSVIGKIPYFKEAISIFSGYGSTRTDTQWMESFANAIKGWMKVSAGEGNPVTATKNSFRALSDLFGIPLFNAYRDFMAALNKLDILTAEELEEMLKEFFS